MKTHPILLLAVVCLLTPAAQAMFMRPQPVPVERLLKNAEAYLAAHKDDADARYTVARIHYLAFAGNSAAVPAFTPGNDALKPDLPPNWMLGSGGSADLERAAQRLALEDIGERDLNNLPADKKAAFTAAAQKRFAELGAKLGEKERIAHATAALTRFRDLVKKEPGNALYQLGLASLLEQIADWKDTAKPAGLTADLKVVECAQACDAYLAAYRVAYAADSQLRSQPISGLVSLLSYEAGNAYVRLAGKEPKPTAQLTAALAEVQAGLGTIQRIPRNKAVTPIIFALRQLAGADELLAPETLVEFDLRGYGLAERWPWVRPDTALLVWDPTRSGEITSGQQLFGGYTFQIFRANGYDALAALDDNGDGTLTGAELVGIRAWFDGNGDGVSAPSEVRDLAELGITGISVRATGPEGPHLKSEAGLIFSDGRTLPTWDWMAEPAQRRAYPSRGESP
jgi:hypothetical protein